MPILAGFILGAGPAWNELGQLRIVIAFPPGSPAELAALVKSDAAKWSKLIADKKTRGG